MSFFRPVTRRLLKSQAPQYLYMDEWVFEVATHACCMHVESYPIKVRRARTTRGRRSNAALRSPCCIYKFIKEHGTRTYLHNNSTRVSTSRSSASTWSCLSIPMPHVAHTSSSVMLGLHMLPQPTTKPNLLLMS